MAFSIPEISRGFTFLLKYFLFDFSYNFVKYFPDIREKLTIINSIKFKYEPEIQSLAK
jgi:hypothetical protein